jgi:ABC-type transport system substrate-binding protein
LKRLSVFLAILLFVVLLTSACGGSKTTTAPATTVPVTSAPAVATTTAAPGTQAPVPTTSKPATTTTAAATATTAPATSVAPKPSSKYGGTLRIIEISAPGAPIGAEWEGNLGTYNTQQWVMERLLIEKKDGSMGPALAESWDVTSTGDNPSIVFHLRQGVKFHDGADFNAAAVAWNFDMFKKANMFGSTTNFWKSWDILDNYTIRINYTTWRNTNIRSWENYFMASPRTYEVGGIQYVRTHMVGTGPFMQTDYQKDVSMTAVRNPNYWAKDADGNQLPYLDKVVLLYVADELTRETLWKTGGAEMLNSNTKQASRLASPDYVLLTRPGGPTILAPDSNNPASPYANLNVRMAVEYAIDREALAKSFGFGYDKAAYQLSSSATLAYDPSIAPRMYDPAKAAQLMKDGGYPSGFKTTIYVAPGANRDPVVAIQAYLAKIGIAVTLSFPEPASWQSITTQPTPVNSMIYIPLNEWSNYNTTLNVFFSGTGFYLPSNKKPAGYTDLFNRSVGAPAPDKALLQQVSNAFYNDCTVVPTVYSTYVFFLKPTVKDSGLLEFGTFNCWDYARVWISK